MAAARRTMGTAWLVAFAGLAGGCVHQTPLMVPPEGSVPRELAKTLLPPYVIEPPDVLLVQVQVAPVKPESNPYASYLPPQPIEGQHMVGPDGTISLGMYGAVTVAGLTLDEARERVRDFISKQANKAPNAIQVTVNVIAYNSKTYWVISDGAGYGEQVAEFPITGNETVLNAVARIGGIPAVGSKKYIWVARRSATPNCPEQILPVDWCAITQQGMTTTNYQVLPGDRIYIKAEPIFSIDNALAKFISPVERVFGITLLGSSTVNSIKNRNGSNNNNGG